MINWKTGLRRRLRNIMYAITQWAEESEDHQVALLRFVASLFTLYVMIIILMTITIFGLGQ